MAHQNNKLLPSVTSSNSSSSSSSSSDSDDESSGEGVKSEDSEEEEAVDNRMESLAERDERVKSKNTCSADTCEAMDTSTHGEKERKENVATSSSSTSSSSTSSEEDKSSAIVTSDERTKDQSDSRPSDSTMAAAAPRNCEVPVSGVYDPTYPSMTLHVAFKVMEYLEAMQQRLITASLAVEVGVHCHMCAYVLVYNIIHCVSEKN